MKEQIITSRITVEEQETHCIVDKDTVIMDSTISKDFNKAIKQGWEVLSVTKYDNGVVCGMTLKAPRKALSIRNAEPVKRVITEEQRAAAAERLKFARENRKENN